MTRPAPPTQTPQPQQISWQVLRQLPNFVRLYWRLFRDRRVSVFPKALLVLTAVYVISPIDVIPDALPILGQIDDLVLLLAACKAFMYLCPRSVVQEHVRRIDAAIGA
jgi:uncharacterized membrane protein YkvA (DUF1232 family)